MIGTVLGRYRVIRPLGRGGMGEVFLAEDPMLGRKLAIKVLPREFALDPERRSRLLHEARAASALNHPNIITVYDLGESDDTLFVVVELIEGETLREWIGSSHRSTADVVRIARQAAQALAVAHTAGLVHRDLKPENLMVRRDGLLKILDFGLARSVSPGRLGQTATMPGTVMGTAPYMSPEQVLGQAAGPASDVFSLGTILYELLTGRHPFAAESQVETMHRILHEAPEAPTRLDRTLSPDFDFVLGKALSKDPRRRHSSMSDLDIDLETLECGCNPSTSFAEGKSKEGAPRTIAVLPFKNIGGAPELSYLGVGLADAVITRLSHSPDLIVRTTSSILEYEDKPVDPRRVGQELDTSAVLDSSFQKAGERFRATARLVESSTGRPLWAGKVDVRFEDIFEVQDQVANGIAEALTARLSPAAGTNPAAAYVPPRAAYEHVLRGRASGRAGTESGIRGAIESYEAAVRLDPKYVQAWALLAFAYHAMIDAGYSSNGVWYERAEETLERALALDPDDPEVRFAAGALHLVRGRKREAYKAFSAALSQMPNSPDIHHYFGYLFRLCDMVDEAMMVYERAVELDPYLVWPYAAIVRYEAYRGRFKEAREWMERERQKCGSVRGARMEVLVLAYEGRLEEALEKAREWRTRGAEPETPRMPPVLLYHFEGRDEEALRCFEQLRGAPEIDMDVAAEAGEFFAQLGDFDKAFHWLDHAVELGNDSLTFYERSRFLEPVRSDPRWPRFIEGVRGRVAQWKREFRWPPA